MKHLKIVFNSHPLYFSNKSFLSLIFLSNKVYIIDKILSSFPAVYNWTNQLCNQDWTRRAIFNSSVQSFSHVWLFATPCTTECQASLSITNSWSLPKLMSIESMMPSNHLILCLPLLLLPSIFPSIRVFSNESALRIRWPKYWGFNLNISPSNEHPGLISFRMDRLGILAVQETLKSLLQPVQKHQFFGAQLSLESNSHIHTWLLEKP